MKKIILATLILGVAFFNVTNVSFNNDNSELSLFQLKIAQACYGEGDDAGQETEPHQHGSGQGCPDSACVDGLDENGNTFWDETSVCTVNCSSENHDNHYGKIGTVTYVTFKDVDPTVVQQDISANTLDSKINGAISELGGSTTETNSVSVSLGGGTASFTIKGCVGATNHC